MFTMTLKVGGNSYSGQGKNKKSAKQAAATAGLEAQDTWYNPPVKDPIPPGLEEEVEEHQPPVKRRTIINQEDMFSDLLLSLFSSCFVSVLSAFPLSDSSC